MAVSRGDLHQVRHLRIGAPDPTLAGRALRLLDDALRIASLPGVHGRLLFVRSFRLRFAAGVPSQSLSLALEQRIATIGLAALHGAEPAAGNAPAVWFRDALEVHSLLALRIAEHAPRDEWFWPHAVPAFAQASGNAQQLRAVLFSLARRVEAPAALPRFVQTLVERGHARTLREALHEADAQRLLEAGGFIAAAGTSGGPRSRPPSTGTHASRPAAGEAVSRSFTTLIAQTGVAADDVRNRWISAMLTAAGAMPDCLVPLAQPAPRQRLRTGSQAQHERIDAEAAARKFDRGSSTRDRGAVTPAAAALASELPRPAVTPSSSPPKVRHADEAQPSEVMASEPRAGFRLEQLPWPSGAFTSAGGLLFLLPVLARLGYVEWLEASPAWAALHIERRVFALLCAGMNLPPDDPAWLLATVPANTGEPRRFCAPALWTEGIADGRGAWFQSSGPVDTRVWDASGRLLLGASPGRRRPAELATLLGGRRVRRVTCSAGEGIRLSDAVTVAWLTACRRWLRRYAGLGVAALVARPARLSLTPTHADMEFELSSVNLAVRRAGLDLDPGWLAWFGRVVSFHYRNA